MSAQKTAITFLNTSVTTLNTNITTLSTGTIGRFSSLSNAIVTSNIVISNAATSPNYLGYAFTSSNAGIRVVSPQTGGIFLSNPSAPLAEVLFNTVGNGGTLSAIGVDSSSRGAFWFVNGNDMVNVGTNNLSIKNNFAINTNYTLYVNGNIGAASTVTITGGGLQLTNATTTNSVFNSTNLTVLGSISTTGSLICLGRFNTPNLANVSTLIVGDNIASTARVSVDIFGSYKTRAQTFFSTGTIQVNNGNIIYANISTAATFNLPQLNTDLIGLAFWMHKTNGGGMTVTLSTSGSASLGTINDIGNTYTAAANSKLVSIMCLDGTPGNASWHVIDL